MDKPQERTRKHLLALIAIKIGYLAFWIFVAGCAALFFHDGFGVPIWLAVVGGIFISVCMVLFDEREEDSKKALFYPVTNYLKR